MFKLQETMLTMLGNVASCWSCWLLRIFILKISNKTCQQRGILEHAKIWSKKNVEDFGCRCSFVNLCVPKVITSLYSLYSCRLKKACTWTESCGFYRQVAMNDPHTTLAQTPVDGRHGGVTNGRFRLLLGVWRKILEFGHFWSNLNLLSECLSSFNPFHI